MHKDQVRVAEAVLPRLTELTQTASATAERDCTVVNRLLIQGPDPLFLMVTCPDLFEQLCSHLDLEASAGGDAIEKAHWYGPGSLLDHTRLPHEYDWVLGLENLRIQKAEALWLLLASVSDCTEEGYTDEITLVERMIRANKAVTALTRLVAGLEIGTLSAIEEAFISLRSFIRNTELKIDERGFPHVTVDHGFYVGYKLGHPIVANHVKNGLVFWGTDGSVTLDAARIAVDKKISEFFGIVFPPAPEVVGTVAEEIR